MDSGADPGSFFSSFITLAQTHINILFGIVFVLVFLSAYLSLVETAFLNMSKGKLRFLVDEEVPKANELSELLENQEEIYQAMTVGNTILNVTASALGTYAITLVLPHLLPTPRLVLALAIMTFIILVFGEAIPEALGRIHPDKTALNALAPTRVILVILRPFVHIFYGLSKLILRMFGVRANSAEQTMTKEELKNIIDGSVEEGVLDLEEKTIIDNVTEFGLLRVADVMTQRYDMVALEVNASYEEVEHAILTERFSRIPVYRETTDDIVGILYVKDLVTLKDREHFCLADHLRPASFTYEFKSVQDLFREMRRERVHLAVVLDEYGGTVGIVSIEDFLEAIVGDIDDEYDDEPETSLIKTGESTYEMEGSTKLMELANDYGFDIESDTVDTVGGFLIEILGTFPQKGQVIPWQKYEFTVLEAENFRVDKVRLKILANVQPREERPVSF